MRYTWMIGVMSLLLGSSLAPSQAQAQFIALETHVDIRSLMTVTVTQDGSSTECYQVWTPYIEYVLTPEVGSWSHSSRDIWCAGVQIHVSQRLETTRLEVGTNHIRPQYAKATTIIDVTYEDGTTITVSEDEQSYYLPQNSGTSYSHTVRNIPGIVFTGEVLDHLEGWVQ